MNNAQLPDQNARTQGVDEAWSEGNQEWWDWYVTLAEGNRGRAVELRELPALPKPSAPTEADLDRELTAPFPLTGDQIESFRREGFIKLRQVFSPNTLLHLRTELARLLADSAGQQLDGGVRGRFLSLDMVWLENELVRRFVLSPRIGELAAELLGVPSVRLYHDNIMSKEPGCGRTPWHYDDHHFPLATQDVVTVWIPLQPIPHEMGPLAFARSMEAHRLVESIPFNKFDTSYDRRVAETFRENNIAVENGPFELGEISFHHNVSFHTAGSNDTLQSRIVLSNTFFADGARIVDRPTMISGDWQKFAPGVTPGERLATRLNPVCWPPNSGDDRT